MKQLLSLLLLAFALNANSQISINTDGSIPDISAMLDVKSTSKGFLPPRMTTAQRNTIAYPAAGLVIYNTDEKALNLFNGMDWNSLAPVPVFVCGLTITINHVVFGGVAPVNKTVAYGTVNGIAGVSSKCWITRNLGAAQQATGASDATEASAGWYWQFNRKFGYKHDGTTRTPGTSWISSINESSDWTQANDPCALELGAGWRIPTFAEWNYGDASWSGGLYMHEAGFLSYSDGSLNDRGLYGNYWSSAQYSATIGWGLYINSTYRQLNYNNKANGYSVRCVRD